MIPLCVGLSLHLMLISLAILLDKSCDQGPRDTILYTPVPALRKLSLAGEIPWSCRKILLAGTLGAPFLFCFSSLSPLSLLPSALSFLVLGMEPEAARMLSSALPGSCVSVTMRFPL